MGILLLAAAATAAFLWNRYLNKNSLIRGFETQGGQQVYLLGTFHENHFDRWLGYSMEDVLSAVENVDPDVVFLEARESVLEEYGVVGGHGGRIQLLYSKSDSCRTGGLVGRGQ